MRLHSDTITAATVRQVMADLSTEGKIKGVYAETFFRGSRTRKHGFDLKLTADERPGRRRRVNPGDGNPTRDVAATWDEWGIVLNALFTIDPDMTGDYYADAEHYEWATGGRFANGGPAEPHDIHRWDYADGHTTCTGCGAKRPRGYFGKASPKGFEEQFGRKWGERITAGASA
jgi:hypothetical protein